MNGALRALASAAVAVLVAGPTMAGGGGEVWDKGQIWYDGSFKLMTCDNATSDSDCVGDPKTPMCAAETYLAWYARDQKALHDIALGKRPGPPAEFTKQPNCAMQLGYRVTAIRQYRSYEVPAPTRNYLGLKEGDVTITMETTAYCDGHDCRRPTPDNDRSFLLRRGEFGWYMIYWDNRRDFTDPGYVKWSCPGWPDGWTGDGDFPSPCPPYSAE